MIAMLLFILILATQDYHSLNWEFKKIKIESVSDGSTIRVRSFDQRGNQRVNEIITHNGEEFTLSLQDPFLNKWTELSISNEMWQIPN